MRLHRAFLTEDGELVPQHPDEGRLLVTGTGEGCILFFWANCPESFAAPANADAAWIPNQTVHATLWFEVEGAAVSHGIDDLAVWFGTTRTIPIQNSSFSAPGTIMDGRFKVDLNLTIDSSGIVATAGDQVQLLIGSGMVRGPTTSLHVVTGGDQASYVEYATINLTGQDYSAPADATERVEPVEVAGFGIYFPGPNGYMSALPHQAHVKVPLAAEPTYLRIVLEQTGGVTGHERTTTILYLWDEEGEFVGKATAPGSAQEILLVGPTIRGLGGQTLDVEVGVVFGVQTTYDVRIVTA